MRNISEYPITFSEMVHAVERAYADELEKSKLPGYPIGGIHIAALKEAASRLRRIEFAVEDGK